MLPFIKVKHIPYVFVMETFDNITVKAVIDAVQIGQSYIDGVYCERVDSTRIPNYFQ